MKQSDFKAALDNYKLIDNAIREVGEKFLEVKEGNTDVTLTGYQHNYAGNGVTLYGVTSSHCGCCRDDECEWDMPYRNLWTDWYFEHMKMVGEDWAGLIEADIRKDESMKRRKALEELATYNKLKAKFGD